MVPSYMLRDGSTVDDPRLDRLVQFDEKSRKYPVRMLVANKKPRSYTWKCPVWLDQGTEGACVGFSTAQKIATRYAALSGVDNRIATMLYKSAQKLDEWEGEDYEGSSVLGGMKAAQQAGFIKSYHWAFTIEEVILALGYNGGGVAGINWYTGMFQPDINGIIKPSGSVAGGHAILVNGIDLKRRLVRFHNSWGRDWGVNGEAFMDIDEFAKLLKEDGEFAVPVRK